jgi:hypothetical protein
MDFPYIYSSLKRIRSFLVKKRASPLLSSNYFSKLDSVWSFFEKRCFYRDINERVLQKISQSSRMCVFFNCLMIDKFLIQLKIRFFHYMKKSVKQQKDMLVYKKATSLFILKFHVKPFFKENRFKNSKNIYGIFKKNWTKIQRIILFYWKCIFQIHDIQWIWKSISKMWFPGRFFFPGILSFSFALR